MQLTEEQLRRRADAVRMRSEGATFRTIAKHLGVKHLGVTGHRVSQLIKAEERRQARELSEHAERRDAEATRHREAEGLADKAVRSLLVGLDHFADSDPSDVPHRQQTPGLKNGDVAEPPKNTVPGDVDPEPFERVERADREIEEELASFELRLGIKLPRWPPTVVRPPHRWESGLQSEPVLLSCSPQEAELFDVRQLRAALGLRRPTRKRGA